MIDKADPVLLFVANLINDHVEQVLVERDKRYDERFRAVDHNLLQAVSSLERSSTIALTAANEAVNKAETATEKRFDSVNEFRGQLADLIRTFMPRNETQVLIDNLREQTDRAFTANKARIDALDARENQRLGEVSKSKDNSGTLSHVISFIAVSISVLSLIASVILSRLR